MRKTARLTLALLAAAGFSVSVSGALAQASSTKSSSAAKPQAKGKRKVSRRVGRRERGQKVPTSDRVSEIQQALSKDGSYSGTPTGKWDDATVEATKKFQESHGLNPTGKLDAKTLQKLGLGSETAGAAAPLPPVSSSAVITPPVRTTPRQQQ